MPPKSLTYCWCSVNSPIYFLWVISILGQKKAMWEEPPLPIPPPSKKKMTEENLSFWHFLVRVKWEKPNSMMNFPPYILSCIPFHSPTWSLPISINKQKLSSSSNMCRHVCLQLKVRPQSNAFREAYSSS